MNKSISTQHLKEWIEQYREYSISNYKRELNKLSGSLTTLKALEDMINSKT